MPFIHDNFLLQSDAARELYHSYAKGEPICDYHCHLPPEDIAENRRFENLFDIWLAGDHYKWRAMRSDGVAEAYCTGDAAPYEKYLAWCRTVPNTLRNPLYHWSHLELARYFGIDDVLISEDTAEEIWNRANEKLQTDALSARGILETFDVRMIGTTDDPVDSLTHHAAIRKQGLNTKVVPTFRPDKGLKVDELSVFHPWLASLGQSAEESVDTFDGFLKALKKRHDTFHEMGARLSDHGLERCFFARTNESEVSEIFDRAVEGRPASAEEKEKFAFYVMREVGRWNAAKGWTMQLHVGAMRNNNTRLFNKMGADVGFDSIGDFPQLRTMSSFLNALDETGELPKTIIYNLNISDNYGMASMIGNFQDGSLPGKIQMGSGWWFLDQKDAMEDQMNALSNLGLFSRFVGMLTDSRSLLSYPRHEYFRRVLCDLVGRDVEKGELPSDMNLVGGMVKRICFSNAEAFFGFEDSP